MINTLYLIAFGLLFLTSTFLTFAWGSLALRRGQRLRNFKNMYYDRYMVIAVALSINSAGTSWLFLARLLAVLIDGVDAAFAPGFMGYMVFTGMSIMLFGKFGFMWAIELDRKDRWWILFLLVCLAWTVFAACFEVGLQI